MTFLAIVADAEEWNPLVHQRLDLGAFDLTIQHAEGQLAMARLTLQNPLSSLSELEGRRALISERGRLLFDGVIQGAPRGLVGVNLTVEIVARPIDPATLDAQLAVLAEEAKVAPFWDALFVPRGRESDWAEILAARTQVLAHSRIQGEPSICNALAGSSSLAVRPFKDSVFIDMEARVSERYGVRLEARWKQLVAQPLNDGGVFNRFTTMTPDPIIAAWPKVGANIGDGWTVTSGRAEKRTVFGKPRGEKTTVILNGGEEELDPTWTRQVFEFQAAELNLELFAEYRYEAARTEKCEVSLPAMVQPGVVAQAEEWETLFLRDLTLTEERPAWQPFTDYLAGDERIDGRYAFAARVDHRSGATRTAAEWSLLGESDYLSSRRSSSFFRTERGRAALAHAVERMKARATMAARCVRVSFEAVMPRPWLVTPDMTISITSAKVPGGTVGGRLVDYTLSWQNGRRTLRGTIACAAGTGAATAPTLGFASGFVPSASGRLDITVAGLGEEQAEALVGIPLDAPPASVAVPETVIKIVGTPAAATAFEQTAIVPISGAIAIPNQVQT